MLRLPSEKGTTSRLRAPPKPLRGPEDASGRPLLFAGAASHAAKPRSGCPLPPVAPINSGGRWDAPRQASQQILGPGQRSAGRNVLARRHLGHAPQHQF
ncbi:hypothetical protein NDU88_005366 [Pleurodeles waltl]|uniref:Uncharacterized protein n=1 Tax=Pleurodeles waltl TaxID=8319 RepID=A0AAV7V6H0_PLEWA|nr:hypothetical protein NDU88_005366 [Pleurodeles waltl]